MMQLMLPAPAPVPMTGSRNKHHLYRKRLAPRFRKVAT
jgi:hypothetical protein